MQEQFHEKRRLELLHAFKYNIENWSQILEDAKLTFPTRSIDLSQEEAQEMIKYYRKNSLSWKNIELNDAVLQQVQTKIATCMSSQFANSKVFVRLSTRSPKDAPLFAGQNLSCHERLVSMVQAKLANIYKTYANKPFNFDADLMLRNLEYCALWDSLAPALACADAQQAMELLMNSERVFLDLLSALEFPEYWSMKIVVRPFIEGLPYSGEFRGFVYNNQLTAVSQYDPTCFYLDLPAKVDVLSKKVVDYFNQQVAPLMAKQVLEINKNSQDVNQKANYIIDFGVFNDGTIKVIELNCVQDYERMINSSGSGCFSWQADADVIQGKKSFEFRVVKQVPFENYDKQVSYDFTGLIEAVRAKALKQVEEEAANANSCTIL